jgi:hypothetical protein
MEIKDLPIELRKLVKKRQMEQGNNGTFEGFLYNDEVQGNFNWDVTPEGNDFWETLNSCGVNNCKRDYPDLYPKSNGIVTQYEIC